MQKQSRKLNLEPTVFERALSHVMPKTAQRLHKGRMQFEVQASFGRSIGGYIGARRDRAATSDWVPGGGSAASDINPDLPMLRDRSRDQMRNSPVALGALNTDVVHVVGTGLSYTPAIDAKLLGITEARAAEWSIDTKQRVRAWAESPDCHVSRQLDFYSQVELSYRSWRESGDCFVLTPMIERDGEQVLALQLIEADRVCNPKGQRDTDTLQDGVELNPDTGEPIAIHVAKYHPGDMRGGANTWTRVEIRGATGRRNVIHLFDALRPGQVRGVPWIAPILEPLKQLGKWSDAELNAAVISSMFVVFMEMDAEAFSDIFDDQTATRIINDAQKWSGKLESGKAVNLLPGEKANMQAPGRPNPEFDPFWQSMVAQLGMALGMPKEVLLMHFQSSYTAARAAFVMAWRQWNQRRDKVAKLLCQPVLDLWLANEVRVGRIAAPGFFASKTIRAAWCAAMWTGDGPGSVDPVKEVTAAKMRVDMNISTLQAESILYDGQDWEAKQRQRAKEVEAQRRDGTLAPSAVAPANLPAPGEGEDNNDDDTETPPPQQLPRVPAPQQRRGE
jgi:lambda family phage portal protein